MTNDIKGQIDRIERKIDWLGMIARCAAAVGVSIYVRRSFEAEYGGTIGDIAALVALVGTYVFLRWEFYWESGRHR